MVGGFGGIGTVSAIGSNGTGKSEIESLQKRLTGLAKCNSELLARLQDKEQQISKLNKVVTELEKNCSELKASIPTPEKDASQSLKAYPKQPMSESQLIIQLQKQLESERLNSHSLKQQLELERAFSARLAEEKNSAQTSFASMQNGSFSSNGGQDSLGLRSLLSSFPSTSSTPSFSIGPIGETGFLRRDLLRPPATW
jgi:chromosome segregation ATPase